MQAIATFHRYQGVQAPVVLASPVSRAPGIMKDVVRANTLPSRASSELHFFGPFLGWDNCPPTAGWLGGLRVTADQVQQAGCSREEVKRVPVPGVLNQQPILSVQHDGVIYRFKGGKEGVVGQWLWKPWMRHKQPQDP